MSTVESHAIRTPKLFAPNCPPGSHWDDGLGACVNDCPPGTTFDPFYLQCIPNCGPGQEYDPVSGGCVPISDNPGLPPVTTPVPAGGGSVTLNVKNTINITDQVLSQLAEAIQTAIDTAQQNAVDASVAASKAVTTGIGDIVNGIQNGVSSFFGSFGTIFKSIGEALAGSVKDIIGFLHDNIGSILSGIRDDIKAVIEPLANIIDKIATEVQHINDTLIQPVTTVILSTIQTIGTLTTTIERDLHDGIAGILKIPTDIANNLTSLDATLDRSLKQLGDANLENAQVTLGGSADDTIHTRLKALNDSILTATKGTKASTTFTDVSHLTEPDIAQAGAKTFNAIWSEIITFISDLFSFGKPSLDALKTLPIAIPFLFGETIEFPVLLLGLAVAFVEAMEPLLEFIKDDINLKSGLAKLQPQDAIAAWVRGFVSDENLAEELGVRGWDASRIKVLKDLQAFLADPQTAIDQFFRGIISSDDLTENLNQHFINPAEQQALVQQAYKLYDVGRAATAYIRGEMDQETLDTILRQNRFQDNELETFKSLLFSPESTQDLIERHKRNTLYSNHLTNDSLFNTVPDDITLAAQANGEGPQTAADRWMQQFQVPGIQHWVQLFFRGIRTHTELFAAMDYWRVPAEWRDDYIQAQRALIPFRTIPAMVKAGIINEAYAAKQLAAHGFDDTAINALLTYAQKQSTTATATAALKTHGESVQVAQELFNLGAITTQQYTDVLKEHGFTDTAIAAEVQLSGLKQQVQHRKEIAAEIISEALAGTITYEQAQQQLSTQGFSQVEQSRYLRQLRSTKKAQSKLPSEAQLVAMVKNKIIDQPTFTDVLIQSGYSQDWADKITTLHFAPATPAGG